MSPQNPSPSPSLLFQPVSRLIPQTFIEHLLCTRHFLSSGTTVRNKTYKTPSF